MPERRTLLFRVGKNLYGCDIDVVREVVPHRPATRLPGSPPFVQGLINLRGTILTVLDLGNRLEPSREPARRGSIIVVQVGNRHAGVVVDEVLDVRAVQPDPAGDELQTSEPTIVRKLGHLDDTVVLLVDIPALVSQALV